MAWSRKHRIWARVRLAGHGWGPVHAIGTSIQRPGTISAAAGGRGRFLVSWQSATIADEERGIPATITIKAAAASSGRWHASLLELTRTFLDLGQVPATEVAFHAGSGLVAWEGVSAGSTAIKTATLGRDGSFSLPPLVSVPGRMAWFGDLAVGPTGGAVLVWLDPSALPTALVPVASYASPGQPFGLPAGLMPGARGALGMGASISPVTGLPTVTWSAALANGTPAVLRLHAAVALASRAQASDSSGRWITSTGTGLVFSTSRLTLPRMAERRPPSPREPMTTRSWPPDFASETIARAG